MVLLVSCLSLRRQGRKEERGGGVLDRENERETGARDRQTERVDREEMRETGARDRHTDKQRGLAEKRRQRGEGGRDR